METPEGKYLIEFLAEGIELEALRRLLSDLMGEGPLEFVRFLEATRWEIPSELEETAHQFRAARLSDLGFPSLEEAASLFARVNIPTAAFSASPGSALAQTADSVDYLGAALDGLLPGERDNAQEELVHLANAVLVAEATDPGDLEAVRRAGGMARDYLNLGFDLLTQGDAQVAAQVLRETPLRLIFQTGFSITLQLKFRADRLMKEPLAQVDGVVLLLDEEAAAVSALRRKRPLRALKVEGSEPVSFRNRRELAEAQELLARAEGQLALLRALFGDSEPKVRQAIERCSDDLFPSSAQRLLSAAVAWALLEGRANIAPVASDQLAPALGKMISGSPEAPSLREDAVQEAAKPLGSDALGPLVDRVLRQWVNELGALYLRRGNLMPIARAIIPVRTPP
jgi:hypothetical protein